MSLVRRLYEQFRQLIHEGAKFLVVGGIGLVVTNLVYDLVRTVGPIKATTVATIVATVVTYFGNRYWSFRHRERSGFAREGIIFVVLNAVGLLIQDAVVGFNAYALGLQHNQVAEFFALNFGIGLATLFRFWSYRKWVWAVPAEDPAALAIPEVLPGNEHAASRLRDSTAVFQQEPSLPRLTGSGLNNGGLHGNGLSNRGLHSNGVNGHGRNGHGSGASVNGAETRTAHDR